MAGIRAKRGDDVLFYTWLEAQAASLRVMEHLIIIIEDSDEDYEAIQWALRKTGREFSLHRFNECDAAIEYLRENPQPSLILLDLNLSGTSGHETLMTIKTDEKLCIIPI